MKKVISLVLSVIMTASLVHIPAVFAADAKTEVFSAAADTFVAQGDPGGVYQGDKYLYIRAQEYQVRKSYLKFDLSGIAGKRVSSAVLGLYSVKDNNVPSQSEFGTVKVSAISDVSWNPAVLNWSNMASNINETDITQVALHEIKEADGAAYGKYHEINVTDFINNSESKRFTLVLEDAAKKIMKFASNEFGGNTAPYLKVTYEDVSIPVTGVEIIADSIDMKTGDDPVSLQWHLVPAYATNKNVSWTSSNNNVATVDTSGTVTPVGAGSAVITVTTADGSKQDSCTVNVTLGRIREKLSPSADTYISQGDPDANFQAGEYLYARLSGGNSNEIFMQFDASELSAGDVVSATLNLYYFKDESSQAAIDASAVDGGELPVYGLGKNGLKWNNGTNVTWNSNVPATSDAVSIGKLRVDSEANGGFDKYYQMDVTDYVKGKTDGIYGFKIQGDSASQKAYKFRSNNYSNVNCRPYLTLVCNPAGIAVQSIALDKPVLSLDTSSDSVLLKAEITPYNASSQTITWKSSNTAVAEVSNKGAVTAKSVGTAQITATCGGKSAVCTVTVVQGAERKKVYTAKDTFIDQGDPAKAQANSESLYCRNYGGNVRSSYINFDASYYSGKYIKSARLYLYYYKDPATYTNDGGRLPVTGLMNNSWSSSIENITYNNHAQYIDESGAVACGDLVIEGGADGGFDRYYSVDVTEYIKAVGGHNFSFKIQGPAGVNSAYKFRSADYSDNTKVPYLEILYNPDGIAAEKVKLNKTSLELETGDAGYALTAEVLPELVSKPYVTWSTSDASVAKVSSTGFVTPAGAGEAVITATSGDGTRSASCYVTVDEALKTEKYYPVMDCFADGGDKNATTATSSYLYARSGTARNIYMKFDLSEVDTRKKIHSVTLNMYYFMDTSSQAAIDVSAINGGTLPVYGLANNNWDEASLTYNSNRPDNSADEREHISDLIVDSQANGGFDKFYSADIMEVAQAQIQYDGIVSIRIDGDEGHLNKAYKFYSSNHPNAAYRPYVEVKYAPDNAPVRGVKLDRTQILTTSESAPVTLNARLTPKYPTNPAVVWTSSDNSVATVDSNGTVSPVSAGTAVITVKTADGSFTAKCDVTVIERSAKNKIAIAADTYVNGRGTGTAQNENHGNKTPLYVRKDNTENQTRAAYIKTADYSAYDRDEIMSASLYITRASGAREAVGESSVSIYGITNNWDDSIIWSDQPVLNSKPAEDANAVYVGKITIPEGNEYNKTYKVDVTDYLVNNSENIASFIIVSDGEPYYFHSLEATALGYRPYIAVTLSSDLNVEYSFGSEAGWTAGGALTADITVSEAATEGLANITAVCAVYEASNGALAGISTSTHGVTRGGDTEFSVTYYGLPGDAKDYYAKIIVVKDLNSMMPVAISDIYVQ